MYPFTWGGHEPSPLDRRPVYTASGVWPMGPMGVESGDLAKLNREKRGLGGQGTEKSGDAQDSACSGKTLPYNTYLATEEAFAPDELRSIPRVVRRRLVIYILRPAFQTEDAPPPRERKVNSIASAVHDVIMEIG